MPTDKVMVQDFYCEEVLSGKTKVEILYETENVLAYYHTQPYWEIHIVVIPKQHIPSLLSLDTADNNLIQEFLSVLKLVAEQIVNTHGGARILTNLGEYQESKHLHFHVNSGKQIKQDHDPKPVKF